MQEQQNQPEDQKGIRWMSQTFKGLCASTGVSAVLIIAVSVMIRLLRTKLDMPLILLLLVALLAVFVYGLASTLQNYNYLVKNERTAPAPSKYYGLLAVYAAAFIAIVLIMLL